MIAKAHENTPSIRLMCAVSAILAPLLGPYEALVISDAVEPSGPILDECGAWYAFAIRPPKSMMTSIWYVNLIISPGTSLIVGKDSSGNLTDTVMLLVSVSGSIIRGTVFWSRSFRNTIDEPVDENPPRPIRALGMTLFVSMSWFS
jgi:hypothetical protein